MGRTQSLCSGRRYKGPSLLDALDAVDVPKRSLDKPLRLALYDVPIVNGHQICMGRVECGMLKPGMVRAVLLF